MASHLSLTERFGSLVSQSFETLESILQDQEIAAQDRAAIAFKVLELSGISPQHSTSDLPVQTLGQTSSQPLIQSSIQSLTHSLGQPSIQPLPPVKTELKPVPYSTQTVIQTESAFLPGAFVQISDFLSAQDHQKILKIALDKPDQFVSSTTTTKANNYRQSSILYATLFPEFYELMRDKLLQALPTVLEQIEYPPFTVSQVEMQLTAHNDGCFYKIHNDSGSAETLTRTITYVYYFHQDPKKFSGGELRLYETEFKGGCAIAAGPFKTIEPRNNSVVLFDSRCKHEVMAVHCPSQKFEHGRFTLNGWFRRTETK
ncbi:MAG: 2OG-Fe(II) oxygenase [Microcoleaceae cyanobacterium]